MADFGGTFDATGVKPREDFALLQPGDYPVAIVASGFEENSEKTGSFLLLDMDIIDGPAKGRKLFDRLNLQHPNAQAVEIAQATLSAICHATGKLTVSNSDQLHNIPMLACVKVKPRKKGGAVLKNADGSDQMQNEISTYKPIGAAQVAPASTSGGDAGNTTQTATAGGAKKLPWQR